MDSLRGFVSFLWLTLRTLGASPDHAARRTPDPHHIRGAPAEHRRARPSSPRCGGLVTTDSFVASMITSHPSRSPDSPADEPILRTSRGMLPEKPEPSFGTIAVASNLTFILLPHACCAPAQHAQLLSACSRSRPAVPQTSEAVNASLTATSRSRPTPRALASTRSPLKISFAIARSGTWMVAATIDIGGCSRSGVGETASKQQQPASSLVAVVS